MSTTDTRRRLIRAGLGLEGITLAWNVVGVVVLAVAASASGSIALLGFGLDSLIEIFASLVVIWELTGSAERRQHLALRLIGVAFLLLAAYLLVATVVGLATGHRAPPSPLGAGWTAATALVMFLLAFGKARVGRRLGNPVLVTEGRVTLVDGILATSVLVGIGLNGLFGWWWADPVAGLVIVVYAIREAVHIFRE